ncbi:aldehyde dehydrogenase family protein, partial [Tsukamurella paurometabola]
MDSRMVESYACGRWHRAADEGRAVISPVDGTEVARVSSTGLDVAAMAAYARETGGPALAELTFHERAAVLKTLGLTLMAGKGEFYAESARTGATERDSAVDIDGGFGTLLSYASKSKRELPNDV